jgi:hypothetical protein
VVGIDISVVSFFKPKNVFLEMSEFVFIYEMMYIPYFLRDSTTWVILWQLYKISSFVYMKGIFVTNVSFATVRLINHSWDRTKCLASCFIKNIYFLRLLLPWCKYFSLPSQYLKRTFSDLFFNINHKTDMNINEKIVLWYM